MRPLPLLCPALHIASSPPTLCRAPHRRPFRPPLSCRALHSSLPTILRRATLSCCRPLPLTRRAFDKLPLGGLCPTTTLSSTPGPREHGSRKTSASSEEDIEPAELPNPPPPYQARPSPTPTQAQMEGRVQTQQGPSRRQSADGTEEHRTPPAANTSAWAHTEHSTSQWPRAREWLESHQDAQTKVWTVTGTVFAGHVRQLLSGDAVEQTIRRSVFDAAWSLTCQRSGLHFSDGPHTTLDKGKHLALPLRFWEVATGRKHRAIGPWLRTIGDAEPTRITFATDKGTGQWNVTTGKVTCLLPPGVENTAKPLWSPHKINRLRMMIAHVAIQREGAVALMGKIAVHWNRGRTVRGDLFAESLEETVRQIVCPTAESGEVLFVVRLFLCGVRKWGVRPMSQRRLL